MPVWIIIAVLGTIGLTALLSSVLWRLNAPRAENRKRDDSGGPDGTSYTHVGSGGRDGRDSNDGTSDSSDGGGGGDGGGD